MSAIIININELKITRYKDSQIALKNIKIYVHISNMTSKTKIKTF